MQRFAPAVLVAAFVLAPSCIVSRVSTWERVTGRSWELVAIEGEALLPGSHITLRLDDPTQLFGESGVNRYFGSYEQIGRVGFRAGQVASTRMAGSRERMEQENRYLELLKRANEIRYRKTDEGATLELIEDGSRLLTFVPSR